jgi:ASC-1-like (ASCH) protein
MDKDEIKVMLEKKKGLVCREFEKVCPSEMSFDRMKKEMHNIFDDIEQEVRKIIEVEVQRVAERK